MEALQYECVDEPAEYSGPWMIYYKHHTYKDALQYVRSDIPSDSTVA